MIRYLLLIFICSIKLFSQDIHTLIYNAVKESSISQIESNNILIQRSKIDLSKSFLMPKSLYLNSNIYGSMEGSVSYSIGPKVTYELYNSKKSFVTKASILELRLLEIEKSNKINTLFNYYYSLLLDIIYNQKLYKLNKEELKSRETYNKNIEERFKSRELSISEYNYSLSTILIYREDEKETKLILDESIILFEAETGINIDNFTEININFDSLNKIKTDHNEHFQLLKELSKTDNSDSLNFRLDLNSGLSYPFDNSSWNLGINFYLDFPNLGHLLSENKKMSIENIKKQQEEHIKLISRSITSIDNNILTSIEKLKVYRESINLLEKSLEGVIVESRNGEATSFDVILFQNRILELKKDVLKIEHKIENYKLNRIFLNGGFTLDD